MGSGKMEVSYSSKLREIHKTKLELQWSSSLGGKLDLEFEKGGNIAAKRCKRKPNLPFSKEIAGKTERKESYAQHIFCK